jgi:hypothetical protein
MHRSYSQSEINSKVEYAVPAISRSGIGTHSYSLTTDEHRRSGVRFRYYRIPDLKHNNKISVIGNCRIIDKVRSDSGNELLDIEDENGKRFILIIAQPHSAVIDGSGRIEQSSLTGLNYRSYWDTDLQIELDTGSEPAGTGTVSVVLIPAEYIGSIEELQPSHRTERMSFRKSNWFTADAPEDFWNYLINGSIYDPRAHQPIGKRFKCQQCAFAWWNYFGYLFRSTEKKYYDLMQDEIAFSIMCDLDEEGAWRHGFWFDDMEIHSRFHLDGINLLVSQYEKDGNEFWLAKARAAMDYVVRNLTDTFRNGDIWFLHDSIEEKDNHKFFSGLFGKNEFNTLCLNTHIQALCVLQRLKKYEVEGGPYTRYYTSGYRALHTVMEHRPAEYLYKALVKLFVMQKKQSNGIPVFKRIRKAAASRLIGLLYWKIKEEYPRIVLPGGLIERDLNVTRFSDRYHIINIKDLLSLYMTGRDERLVPYIRDGFKFIGKLLDNSSLDSLLNQSPYYIEYLDVMRLYNDLIEPVPETHIKQTENTVIGTVGGTSLDYYASYQEEE